MENSHHERNKLKDVLPKNTEFLLLKSFKHVAYKDLSITL